MNDRRSIIQAADYAPTYSGNFIASLKAAEEECRARGYRMVWVFPDIVRNYAWFRDLSAEKDFTAYTLSRGVGWVANAKALARIALAENAAIIHTHFSTFDISAWLAQAVCAVKLRRIKLVWHAHSAFTENSPLRRAKDFLKLGLLGRSCQVVPVSTALGESVAERGCPRTRINVIDNGIDIEHATGRRKTREDVRREWQIPEDALVMLSFGWTPVRKGVDTMLEALAILLQEKMNLALVIAGTDELQRFIANWPDRDCLSRVRVIAPAESVGELFAASDLFLSPSRAEGWCYGVAEAMLNQIPVATAKIPPLSWANHAPGVYFCRPGDSPSLAASIRRIVALPEAERRDTGECARKFVTERYSARQWGRQIWTLYERILAG